jgi:hypothetical protein
MRCDVFLSLSGRTCEKEIEAKDIEAAFAIGRQPRKTLTTPIDTDTPATPTEAEREATRKVQP